MTDVARIAAGVKTLGQEREAPLAHVDRRRFFTALMLVCPYVLFLLVSFAIPIAAMLMRSIETPEISETLPDAAAAFEQWDGVGLPPDHLVRIFARDIVAAHRNQTIAIAAKRLNVEVPGFRGLLLQTARLTPDPEAPDLMQQLVRIDSRWAEATYWHAIKLASPRYSMRYLLATMDLEFGAGNVIQPSPPERRIYLALLGRTLWIGLVVTAICLALGYPVAFALASVPAKYSNLMMLLLLLPFWTSLLVRTTAWMVLLQNSGLTNSLLLWLGVIDEPMQLIRNRFGVYVAMTHILLPFAVLPIFSVMKGISPVYMRAAYSLGARPIRAFLKVYLPQTVPGVGAGALLVFIMSLGYYITPALVGGPGDQMLSYFIAENANATLNWGMAAALSLVLILCVGIAFAAYARIVGTDKLRLR